VHADGRDEEDEGDNAMNWKQVEAAKLIFKQHQARRATEEEPSYYTKLQLG
jgi:hypothetical protein